MEPFSLALGIISLFTTAASIMGVLVSTAEKLAEKSREWKECWLRLRSYAFQIDTQRKELRSWQKLWFDALRSERDYVQLWGAEGYAGIRKRLGDIEMRSRFLKEKLPREQSEPGVLEKAAYSLYESSSLKDRITRLKEAIEDLTKFSANQFSERHDGQSNDQTLMRISNTLNEISRLSRWMENVHRKQRSSSQLWNIVLTDNGGNLPGDSEIEDDITIEFLIESISEDCSPHIKKFSYSRLDDEDIDLMSSAQEVARLEVADLHKKYFSSSLGTIQNQAYLMTQSAKASLGLATWVFPLVRTHWTTNLCSCKIHLAICDKNTTHSVLQPGGREECQNHEMTIRHCKYLYLATVLSELILMKRLHTTAQEYPEGDRRTIVYRCGDQMYTDTELVRELGRKSLAHKEAVQHCIELDQQYHKDGVHAEDTARYMRKVIHPLRKYSQRVRRHYQTQRQLEQRQNATA
ncbi:hypothetical protein DE146DRAFT_362216 [Phaeosphaeria sp. MPI-PUGE-AT-0046c]|nr:hypothetical protein DE146DRAFT_362216 [Phaeosphaeria sp. MPI-PUGE-AT-0046c]